ncbi:TetR/AcrR family transcriptional regulator [Roseateles sp. DB2]|uniref:TetR/AcrR family transcriptional regulator n=1 Tax=Roseateles sp. DB2 TaxID=3453717 RepID=UPI003EEBC381
MVDSILEAAAGVLSERGYAGTSTNLVAERAGVSVGSVYQYFPNKDSLVVALHDRHAGQMYQVIEAVLGTGQRGNLRSQVEAMVRALMAAHMVEPRLHRVLEQELPFFEVPKANGSPSGQGIFSRVQQLLEQHRADILPQDLQLAAWVIQRIIESMVHAAVIEAPLGFSMPEIERAIVDAVLRYLGVD